jgi:hypothetical protein
VGSALLLSKPHKPLFPALMPFSKPVSAEVHPPSGQLVGASRRYRKRLSDLNGLYLDASAFALHV